jgi:hypothetical protein
VLFESDIAQDVIVQLLKIGRNDPPPAASPGAEDVPDGFPNMNQPHTDFLETLFGES